MFSSPAPWAKSLRVVIPVGVLALALTACSGGDSGSGSGSDAASGDKIAAVIKGLDNPFFQAMEDGIKDADPDATVQAAADIGDTTGQADKLTTLAGQDFGCYIVNPISGTNLIQALTQVSSAGKTIVNIDSPIDADAAKTANIDIATYIGTDNKAAGGKAGDFVAEQVEQDSEVAIIGGIAGDVTSGARVDGFKAAVDGKLTVIQESAADWKREVALTAATDIIAANPNVKAFFAANDDMGLGIVKAIENAGRTGEIVVVSVDGNEDALESVKAGGLTATVAQYPYAIGQLGVQACEAAAAGDDLPETVESPTALVTTDVADDAIEAFPQPFEEFENPLEK
ncbi:substrate-binding domain-containing protein [Mycetocola miduiensis]|uniref:Ribose transport system substrate-binding protein/D-allose transport system substrate-binding protein n=1 Tax=Mycetocola miduiensis TaxID=995034 RepID=A0A1I4YBZ5_9MICO|nr:substrate-binding domain-containing protein [Mycetocola miduiensis]SFN35516.1 ribose transport system substrate-binding protein/D-allose transport system substrate-binding protein [Mycetocola miduiensis]